MHTTHPTILMVIVVIMIIVVMIIAMPIISMPIIVMQSTVNLNMSDFVAPIEYMRLQYFECVPEILIRSNDEVAKVFKVVTILGQSNETVVFSIKFIVPVNEIEKVFIISVIAVSTQASVLTEENFVIVPHLEKVFSISCRGIGWTVITTATPPIGRLQIQIFTCGEKQQIFQFVIISLEVLNAAMHADECLSWDTVIIRIR
mmetsp:Transcript_23132/g.41710  ORF Transcript_23132/g.41710 Transcript_23132/m.41710 type:complete len:202 (-) Transcript_23132:1307-1912(-)